MSLFGVSRSRLWPNAEASLASFRFRPFLLLLPLAFL